jgi:hypothetical protein
MSMEPQIARRDPYNGASERRTPNELVRLIRKLRWMGMEEEAQRLQAVLSRQPRDQTGTVLEGPGSTD